MSISNLRDSIVTFGEEVKNWRTRLDTLDIEGNPLVARYVNDQMMKLGRVEFYAYPNLFLEHTKPQKVIELFEDYLGRGKGDLLVLVIFFSPKQCLRPLGYCTH